MFFGEFGRAAEVIVFDLLLVLPLDLVYIQVSLRQLFQKIINFTLCREDMEGLKEEILKSVQDLFQSDFIYKVAISGVKFG